MNGRAGLRRWAIGLALGTAALGSAWLWWWRPLMLATLRAAVHRGLAEVRPRAAFRDLDLSGLSTLVLRDVTLGTLDDPDSAVIPEVRLTFDLRVLLRSRLDVTAALRRVTLVRPQVALTGPLRLPAADGGSGPRIGLPPGVRLAVIDGRLLLRPSPGPALPGHRAAAAGPPVLGVTDITGMVEPGAARTAFSVRLTPPGSPRRSLSVEGSLAPLALDLAVDARGVEVEPLQPWIRPLAWPVEPRRGSVTASLRLELSRTTPGGRWTHLAGTGPLSVRRAELGITGLAGPLRDLDGAARLAGERLTLQGVRVTAPAIPWTGGGTLDRILSPVLALDLVTDAFDPAVVDPDARGAGHCRLRLDGPAAALTLRAEVDLRQASWLGVDAERVRGTIEAAPGNGPITLAPLMAVTVAGTVTLTGEVRRAGTGRVDWALTPRDPLLPLAAGDARWTRHTVVADAKTADGLWTVHASGQDAGGHWDMAATAHATGGAKAGFTGSVGSASPHRVAGTLALAAAPLSALYLNRRSDLLARLPAFVTFSGRVAGTAAAPELAADLKGSALVLSRQRLPVSGSLRLSPRGLELAPVRFPGNTSLMLALPFDGRAATAAFTAEGMPLAVLWPLLPVPDTVRDLAGNGFGHLDVANLMTRPLVTGSIEVRGLAWRDRRLGTLACDLAQEGSAVRISRLALKGPVGAADGTGSFSFTDAGWKAAAAVVVSYLKVGTTDLDARANLAVESRGTARTADLTLDAVRLNAAAYPDAQARWTSAAGGGWSGSVNWEDLLSVVVSVGTGAGAPVAVTVAATDMPLAPVLGAAGLPAPVDKVSGNVSLRGPLDRVAGSADLRWSRGTLSLKGWADAAGGTAFSVTLSLAEGALAPWLPLLRRVPDLAAAPEVTGAMDAHGFALERAAGGAVTANGWISLRDLTVRGQRLGTGRLRVASEPGKSSFEGSFDGEGQYTLYPTTLVTQGDDVSLDSAFAWNRVPACKALCGLARGTLTARLSHGRGTATLALTGLTLNDRPSTDVTIQARAAGSRWTLSAPRESPWQAIGTVSAAAARIVTEPDDRCGGAWVIFKGPEGAQLKLAGAWPLPGAPERLSAETHLVRAAPILVLLGAPPMEGLAEADLDYVNAATPPLSGRLTVTGGQWGDFPFDLFEVKGTGTPAHDFAFTSIKVERAGNLLARGTGSLTVFPERHVELNLSVERLRLGYLAPFGLVEDAEVSALGRLVIAGDPDDPGVTGSLVCAPGSYTPPTGFSELTLTEGRMDFTGHQAAFNATLADAGGAAVLMAGRVDFKALVPASYSVDMAAPALIQVDRLPGLFKGRAKGKFRIDGTPARPAIHGDILLEDGRIQAPRKRKHDPDEFGERADWDLAVHFGSGVKYAVEPIGGATLELASLSPRSLIKVSGRGEDFHVTGQVLADSGPLTLFLGKELWKK